MNNECLICGKPLKYFPESQEMECHFCHRKFKSNTSCEDGHYVCDECHAQQGFEAIRKYALSSKSCNPIEIAAGMMHSPYIHIHGNEHHVLVGAALLTAYHNAGGDINLEKALMEMEKRGKQVPGGACGFWGACGAAISSGMFISIVSGSTPLKQEEWGLSNLMTSKSLCSIGEIGGPRCCKRDSFLSIRNAVDFCAENFGVRMQLPDKIVCEFSKFNNQCIGKRCPFHEE